MASDQWTTGAAQQSGVASPTIITGANKMKSLQINGQEVKTWPSQDSDMSDDSDGFNSLNRYRLTLHSKHGELQAKKGDVLELSDGTKFVCVDPCKQEFEKEVIAYLSDAFGIPKELIKP
jgi:hypothetical protein